MKSSCIKFVMSGTRPYFLYILISMSVPPISWRLEKHRYIILVYFFLSVNKDFQTKPFSPLSLGPFLSYLTAHDLTALCRRLLSHQSYENEGKTRPDGIKRYDFLGR